ncbi:hypothetical protein EMGBS15_15650 [Filimonas sp.]|nr:hypothetical protein EMGBS15_15650 [Filimonas sp.]
MKTICVKNKKTDQAFFNNHYIMGGFFGLHTRFEFTLMNRRAASLFPTRDSGTGLFVVPLMRDCRNTSVKGMTASYIFILGSTKP